MGDVVHARVTAVKTIDHGLASYARNLAQATSSARSEMSRGAVMFQVALVNSERNLIDARRRVEMAAVDLARCREGCEGLQRNLAGAQVVLQAAQRRLENDRRAEAHFERASKELQRSIADIGAAANQAIPKGRNFVRDYAHILTDYLKKQVS